MSDRSDQDQPATDQPPMVIFADQIAFRMPGGRTATVQMEELRSDSDLLLYGLVLQLAQLNRSQAMTAKLMGRLVGRLEEARGGRPPEEMIDGLIEAAMRKVTELTGQGGTGQPPAGFQRGNAG